MVKMQDVEEAPTGVLVLSLQTVDRALLAVSVGEKKGNFQLEWPTEEILILTQTLIGGLVVVEAPCVVVLGALNSWQK